METLDKLFEELKKAQILYKTTRENYEVDMRTSEEYLHYCDVDLVSFNLIKLDSIGSFIDNLQDHKKNVIAQVSALLSNLTKEQKLIEIKRILSDIEKFDNSNFVNLGYTYEESMFVYLSNTNRTIKGDIKSYLDSDQIGMIEKEAEIFVKEQKKAVDSLSLEINFIKNAIKLNIFNADSLISQFSNSDKINTKLSVAQLAFLFHLIGSNISKDYNRSNFSKTIIRNFSSMNQPNIDFDSYYNKALKPDEQSYAKIKDLFLDIIHKQMQTFIPKT
jgi:hypothetical protein